MTPEQFADRMAAIEKMNDKESRHLAADDLIIELLRAIGYSAGADIFDRFEKFYA